MKLQSIITYIYSLNCEQMDLLLDMLQNADATWKAALTAPKQTIVTAITAQAVVIDAIVETDYEAIDFTTVTQEQLMQYACDPAFIEFSRTKL